MGRRHLRDALDSVRGILAGEDDDPTRSWRPPTPRERLERLREQLVPGAADGRAAVRLVLCMVAAEIVSHLDTTQRSYWIPLTVAIVLKPDLGSVFARGLQRGAGTVVGVLLGAAVIELVPVGPWLLPFLALFAAVVPIGQSRNYGAFATFLTPLIVVLIDLVSRLGTPLVVDRLVDSSIGVGIVLLLGYVIWPESWHARLGDRVAATVEGLRTYLDEALRSPAEDRVAARRRAYRRLADLRAAFQQAMTEPGRVGRRALAWWPAVIGLERTTDALTWAAAAVAAGAAPPGERDLDALVRTVDELADAVRRQRAPGRAPLPGDGPLSGVAAELATVRATLGGPDTDEHATGETGREEQRVVDEHGAPLAGVTVTATDPDGAQVERTSTDGDGCYRVAARGSHLLVHALPGHHPVARWAVAGTRRVDDPVVLRTKPV